jgi:long-chain fatty acid transport protein
MNKRNTAVFLVAVAVGGVSGVLFAGGMRLVSQDGFASARGEAFAATADNPSAIYYNPAGITQIEGFDIRGGFYGIHYDTSYSPPDKAANHDSTYHARNNFALVPESFTTYTPADSMVTFGLGIYSPYGGSVEWPQDTGFRAVALKSSLTYATLNPVVALKLLPCLSIGGGVTANYSKIDLESGLKARLSPSFPDYFRFKGDGWSVGYNLGMLWQPHEQVSFGAAFRSSSSVTMRGHTDFARPTLIHPTEEHAQVDYTFPITAVVGLSYRPTPKWNLEFDADYTDWSSFGTVNIQQEATAYPLQKNIALKLDWEPSWIYEFGVTRYFDGGWHVSAGYVYNENSVPDANYTPAVPDMARHFFSVGGGRKGRLFDFDLAYQFGYGPDRTVTGSMPSTAGRITGQNADGTYGFVSHAVLLTVGMHF